jgi:hypothetical protein
MAEPAAHELTWQAPEFEHRPKTALWYWVSIAIAILFLGLAIWQKNYFFGVFIIFAELMIFFWGSLEPRMVTFMLNQKGLTIGGKKFYPFSDIKSWSADKEGFLDPEWPDIFLQLNAHFHFGTKVKAPRTLLPEVEKILRTHAKETVFEATMIDVLEKFLGF